MSGGGGSQTVAGSPWGPATPYLTSIMQQAQELYGRQAPQYSNPAGNFNYGNTTAALGNVISGQPDYSAVNQAIGAANTQQWNQFNNQVVPQLNANASFLGNPTGSIKDLNSAVTNLTQNQSLNAQQAYLGQYDLAKQRQLQGIGMYPTIAGMPNQALSDYANIIGNTGGRYSTQTSALQPGSGQTASNIIGGLTSGVGLYNQLFGGPGSTPLGTQAANYAKGIFSPSTGATAGQGLANAAANPSVYDTSGIASSAGSAPALTGSAPALGVTPTVAPTAGGGLGAGAGVGAGLGAAEPAFAAGGAADVAGTAAASDLAGASMLPSTEAALASGGSAGTGAGSGALLGAGAGAAAAVGLAAAPIIAGMRSSPVVLNSDYWNRFRDSLFKGTSGNANFDKYDSPAQQKALADQTLYSMIQQQRLGQGGSLSGSWNIPADIMTYAKKQGMLTPGYTPPVVSSNRAGGGRGGSPV